MFLFSQKFLLFFLSPFLRISAQLLNFLSLFVGNFFSKIEQLFYVKQIYPPAISSTLFRFLVWNRINIFWNLYRTCSCHNYFCARFWFFRESFVPNFYTISSLVFNWNIFSSQPRFVTSGFYFENQFGESLIYFLSLRFALFIVRPNFVLLRFAFFMQFRASSWSVVKLIIFRKKSPLDF